MARLRLDDFEAPSPAAPPRAEDSDGRADDARLMVYEQGYTAGWDDAVAAQDKEAQALRDTLAANLSDLSFTYTEAHGHVIGALEPLLRDMVAKVLPAIARQSLVPLILAEVMPAARTLAATPVDVTLNAATRGFVEPLLAAQSAIPFRIIEEPSLGDGQCFLRFADRERLIDLGGVVAAIGRAVEDFFAPGQAVRTGTEG
jgi:flagellar assembly protein FliH